MIHLRPYQQEAVTALAQWDYGQGNPLVVVPTGGGKSLIQAAHVAAVRSRCPEARVLCVTHVKELVAQNHDAFLRLCPEAECDAGIYSAGIGRRDKGTPVLFAGLQSVYRNFQQFGRFDVVVVDEVHRVPKRGAGMYRKIFQALAEKNPDVQIVGMTATPFRTDSGALDKGDDRMFHGTAYECELKELVKQGYLSDVHSRGAKASIDTKGVHIRAREFVAEELEQRAMADGLVDRAVDEMVMRSGTRKSWLIFATGILHAEAIAKSLLTRHAIQCGTVFGHTPNDERDETLRSYKAGEIRAIANVGVLTTGFDAPQTDVIALLRPTMSPVLYVQMVGRGLRVAPGKDDGCLLLDFGGNVKRHGPINDVKLAEATKKSAEEAIKECPECNLFMPATDKECPECGYVFPVKSAEPKMVAKHAMLPAENLVIIRDKEGKPTGTEKWRVSLTTYLYHPPKRPGNAPTLRVIYYGPKGKSASQFLCFEHPRESYARMKAERWWRRVTNDDRAEAPTRVGEAVRLLHAGAVVCEPSEITVDVSGKWPDIKRVSMRPLAPAPTEG